MGVSVGGGYAGGTSVFARLNAARRAAQTAEELLAKEWEELTSHPSWTPTKPGPTDYANPGPASSPGSGPVLPEHLNGRGGFWALLLSFWSQM